ncbi:MAG: serine/threonine-protein kinase [Alcanivorax sp.]|nr:serine/threonine-protein kinase [Alcanivorax sp.]
MAFTLPGYRITARLGKGGMAHVFLATQHSFERQVAIKVLTPSLALEPRFAERFMHEARTIASLNHPHIVPVYDVGEHRGHYYLSMEYVTGGSLKARIKAGLEPDEAIRILRQLAQALNHAGKQGFIHCDVKPDNIMFRDDGSALLMDFGIAYNPQQDTRLGDSIPAGTPKYMSPEQHRGLALCPGSDLYSLGCVFYEMLTGEAPYCGDDDADMAHCHLNNPLPLLPDHLARYQPIINALLAKTPEHRPASGEALITLLDQGNQGSNTVRATSVADPSATLLTPRIRLREQRIGRSWRGGLYQYDIFLVADDFAQFQEHHPVIRSGLVDWHGQRGRRCRLITIKATIHPWISGRIKDYLRKLRHAEGLEFLAAIPMHINLVASDGEPIERLEWPAEKPERRPASEAEKET